MTATKPPARPGGLCIACASAAHRACFRSGCKCPDRHHLKDSTVVPSPDQATSTLTAKENHQ